MNPADDPQFWHDYYRHRCPDAEEAYREGVAQVFFDVDEACWYLAPPDPEDFAPWWDDRTLPHPLLERYVDAYHVAVDVDFCPWCGLRLADDPDFAGADAVYQTIMRQSRRGTGGQQDAGGDR